MYNVNLMMHLYKSEQTMTFLLEWIENFVLYERPL